ncbi:hypothetical protein KDL44_02935 [bacterium]|nr:hypothetical protein [bacterium]
MRLAAIIFLSLCLLLAAGPAQAVPMADFAEILGSEAPRDSFTLYRWEQHPDVYVIHFDSYLYQSRALSRMALFQEMAESRGRIMSQVELEAWFSDQGVTLEGLFGAHDYDTQDMARFFSELQKSGQEWYPEELELFNGLLELGLLDYTLCYCDPGLGFHQHELYHATGEQAVISFASRLALRESRHGMQGRTDRSYERGALYHEMLHGIFFTEPEYEQRCREFWQQQLSADERRAFSTLLASLNYDPAFETLMINEFQAYLLTPPAPASGSRILLERGQRLLKPDFLPEYVNEDDKEHFLEHGKDLLERIRGSMRDELRAWVGNEYLIDGE